MANMPSAEDIIIQKEVLQERWAKRNEMIEEQRALRFMENNIKLPAEMEAEEVRSPIGHQIVERMTGQLTADPPTITVPPASEKQKSVEQSSKMEKFAEGMLKQLETQADSDVIDKFVETLIADGHGCMRMLYAPQLWRGFPKRNRKDDETDEEYDERTELWKHGKPIPISFSWLDPLTVYPLWSEAGLEAVMEVDRRDVISLSPDRWNISKPDLMELSRHTETPGEVEFIQYWMRDSLSYIVNGELVSQHQHDYGTPPYAYALGLGAATGDRNKMGYGVLYPVRYLIPYYDRLLSQKGTAIRLWCWPTVLFKQARFAEGLDQTSDDEGDLPLREIQIRPGKPVTIFSDEEITFLTWAGNGPDADEMVRLVQNMIERAGLSDTMYGQSTGDSGYAINQLIAAARMRWKPIIAHAERAIETMVARLFDIVEYQVKQRLYVFQYGRDSGWIDLAPEDLSGYRQIKVVLNPIMPTDEYARSSRALNEVQRGLRSRQGGMEMIGIDQPDEEMRRILVDRWMATPEVQQFLTQQALRKAGLSLKTGDVSGAQLQQAYQQGGPGIQQALSQMMQQASPAGGGVAGGGMAQPNRAMPMQSRTTNPQVRPMAGAAGPGAPQMPMQGGMLQRAGSGMQAQGGMPQGGMPGMPGMQAQGGMPQGGMPQGGMPGMPGMQAQGGMPGMQAQGGMPQQQMAQMAQQALSQLPQQLQQAIQLIAQRSGVSPLQLVMRLAQLAQQQRRPFAQIVVEFVQRMIGGGRSASPASSGGGLQQQAGRGGGQQTNKVMAAPGVPMNPTPPTREPAPRTLGPQQRPSGIATGRAPGVKRGAG